MFKALIHRVNFDVCGEIRIQFSFFSSAPLTLPPAHLTSRKPEALDKVMLKGSPEAKRNRGLLGMKMSA